MTDPGLDVSMLHRHRGRRRDHALVVRRIREHLDRHDGYVALSGGKDSVVVAHLTLQADPTVPLVWFDSGLEYPETAPYLHDLADRWGATLTVIEARPTLLELLVASGGWDHAVPTVTGLPSIDEVVIAAPAALAHRHFGPGELWGVRAAESSGRRIMYWSQLRREADEHCGGCCHPGVRTASPEQRAAHGGVIRRTDGTIAYGPIWDWATEQVWEYLSVNNIPHHPAYDTLRRLGAPDQTLRISHVIGPSRLEFGRIAWLRRGWPGLYAQLEASLPRISEFL